MKLAYFHGPWANATGLTAACAVQGSRSSRTADADAAGCAFRNPQKEVRTATKAQRKDSPPDRTSQPSSPFAPRQATMACRARSAAVSSCPSPRCGVPISSRQRQIRVIRGQIPFASNALRPRDGVLNPVKSGHFPFDSPPQTGYRAGSQASNGVSHRLDDSLLVPKGISHAPHPVADRITVPSSRWLCHQFRHLRMLHPAERTGAYQRLRLSMRLGRVPQRRRVSQCRRGKVPANGWIARGNDGW
jgi:hypothetical protein